MNAATLYGLACEYPHQPERALLVSGQTPLSGDDLVPAEEKMLQHYMVPGLLPVRFEETDLVVKIRFLLENKRTLAAAVSSPGFDLHKMYRLLMRIVSVLEEGGAYLLNEGRFVLKPQFVYMDLNSDEPALLYLPVKELPGKQPTRQELAKLADWLYHAAHGPKTRDRILWDLFESEEYSWSEARKRLQIMIDSELLSIGAAKDATAERPVARVLEAVQSNNVLVLTKRRMYMLGLFAVLAAWSVFAWDVSEGSFYVSTGLSLLAGDAVFLAVRKGKISFEERTPELSIQPASAPMEAAEYYSKLSRQTTLLVAPQATVLLSDWMSGEEGAVQRHVLETGEGSESVQIPLTGDTFVIGRDWAAVNHTDREPGVSRTHLELSKHADGYAAKDLGSKNGSTLNGERMLPFMEYPLQEGDALSLANSVYFYKKL